MLAGGTLNSTEDSRRATRFGPERLTLGRPSGWGTSSCISGSVSPAASGGPFHKGLPSPADGQTPHDFGAGKKALASRSRTKSSGIPKAPDAEKMA